MLYSSDNGMHSAKYLIYDIYNFVGCVKTAISLTMEVYGRKGWNVNVRRINMHHFLSYYKKIKLKMQISHEVMTGNFYYLKVFGKYAVEILWYVLIHFISSSYSFMLLDNTNQSESLMNIVP